jgi:hypothetical protein
VERQDIAIFWDIALHKPYVERRFEGIYDRHPQGGNSAEQETSM